LRLLLSKNQSKRVSVEEALKHPWILQDKNLGALNLHYALAVTKDQNNNNSNINNSNDESELSI